MLHATGRGREEWEDAVGSWEDDLIEDVQMSDGENEGEVRKVGMTVNEMMAQCRKRGFALEGTLVDSRWRKREAGRARKAAGGGRG